MARFITCPEDATVLFELERHIPLDKLSAHIWTKNINHSTGIRDLSGLEWFGKVLEEAMVYVFKEFKP